MAGVTQNFDATSIAATRTWAFDWANVTSIDLYVYVLPDSALSAPTPFVLSIAEGADTEGHLKPDVRGLAETVASANSVPGNAPVPPAPLTSLGVSFNGRLLSFPLPSEIAFGVGPSKTCFVDVTPSTTGGAWKGTAYDCDWKVVPSGSFVVTLPAADALVQAGVNYIEIPTEAKPRFEARVTVVDSAVAGP